ncbi:MAG: hypothetical protein QM808_05015 [Steroidobacteraceae bacterium]
MKRQSEFKPIQLAVLVCAAMTLSACKKIDDTASPVGTTGSASVTPDLSGVWKLTKPVEQLLTTDGKQPPLLPEALQAYQSHIQAKTKGDLTWDPVQRCKPPGLPRTYLENGWPFEIVQTPERVDFLFQWNRMVRAVPVLDKQSTFIGPFYYGQSVGQWQGKAFVVDLVGLNDDVYLDSAGLPHSDDLHMTETFTMDGDGKTLHLTVRIEDPKTFSAPWQTNLEFVRQPIGSITEDDCAVRMHLENLYPVLPAKLYPQ